MFEIGVVADDQRVLAAQFQRDPGEPRAGDARDLAADRGRTREAQHGNSGVRDQRGAGFFSQPLDDVQHSGRQAGLMSDAAEQPGGGRRVLSRLEHGRVAADKRREHFPGRVGNRRVGGDDEPGHPERLADGHGQLGGARRWWWCGHKTGAPRRP